MSDNDIVPESSFWWALSEADRRDLGTAGWPRTYPGDGVLCNEGDPTTHVFVLLSGWVKISAVSSDGRRVLQALRSGGDVVGEVAGQANVRRTATMKAAGPVRALLVDSTRFWDFLYARPAAGRAYQQAALAWQLAAHTQQKRLTLYDGARRLAGLLLDLDDQRRRPVIGAASEPLPLSQEELADLIGASRSTVTRALHNWRSRDIIGKGQRPIELLDRAWLLQYADRAP